MANEKTLNFEEAMQNLQVIVEKLEGEVPLEEAIKLYQEGMQLSALCKGKLDEVEKVMETIMENGSELTTESIDLKIKE